MKKEILWKATFVVLAALSVSGMGVAGIADGEKISLNCKPDFDYVKTNLLNAFSGLVKNIEVEIENVKVGKNQDKIQSLFQVKALLERSDNGQVHGSVEANGTAARVQRGKGDQPQYHLNHFYGDGPGALKYLIHFFEEDPKREPDAIVAMMYVHATGGKDVSGQFGCYPLNKKAAGQNDD